MARDLTSVEEYHRLLAGATSEDELLVDVETRLTLGGWRWHHIGRSDLAQQHGDPGWPDILAVRGDLLIAVELKSERGSYGGGQRDWLEAIEQVRRTYVNTWRPGDRAEIERVLSVGGGPGR